MMSSGGGVSWTPLPMTVKCPGLTGINSVGNSLNTCSILPAQNGRGEERGRRKLMKEVRAPVFT